MSTNSVSETETDRFVHRSAELTNAYGREDTEAARAAQERNKTIAAVLAKADFRADGLRGKLYTALSAKLVHCSKEADFEEIIAWIGKAYVVETDTFLPQFFFTQYMTTINGIRLGKGVFLAMQRLRINVMVLEKLGFTDAHKLAQLTRSNFNAQQERVYNAVANRVVEWHAKESDAKTFDALKRVIADVTVSGKVDMLSCLQAFNQATGYTFLDTTLRVCLFERFRGFLQDNISPEDFDIVGSALYDAMKEAHNLKHLCDLFHAKLPPNLQANAAAPDSYQSLLNTAIATLQQQIRAVPAAAPAAAPAPAPAAPPATPAAT